MADEAIRWPGPTNRLAIVGRTESGKTYAAVWHLSESDFDERPWVILDYKNDELIEGINAQLIDYSTIPDEPGIYILKVLPDEEAQLSQWFKRVWQHEGIGLYVDEGYLIDPRDKWFNAILTQGRSKEIPVIILSQRPVWLSRFVFSEASFFQLFDLSHEDDIEVVRKYVRDDEGQLHQRLDQFNSYYYDVGRRRLDILGPVPDRDKLLITINQRLADLRIETLEIPRRRAI